MASHVSVRSPLFWAQGERSEGLDKANVLWLVAGGHGQGSQKKLFVHRGRFRIYICGGHHEAFEQGHAELSGQTLLVAGV